VAGWHNQFVQDDLALIAQNTRVQDLSHWRDILTSPYWPPPWKQDLYRPLTSLLSALQFQLGAGDPRIFRAVSYALYAAISLGVFLLARRRLSQGIAGGIALLFAVHPVHVEAVALAAGQSELLVGLFSIAAVIRYVDLRQRGDGTLRARDWAGLAALYALACASKETGFVLPALLGAAEFSLVGASARRLWPGYVSLAAAGGLMLAARTAVLAQVASPSPADALGGLSLGGRALTMLQVVPTWARLLIWPAHLRVDYSPREFVASTAFGPTEGFGLFLGIAALGAVWFFHRRAPVVSFGLAWTAVGLLPVSNILIPTGILVAERTLFLPSAGFMVAVGGAAAIVEARRSGDRIAAGDRGDHQEPRAPRGVAEHRRLRRAERR
jgi:hypothetical protein